MNKCVYIHKRLDNGKVFYVGEGSYKRPHSKLRNKYWHNVVNKYGYEVIVLYTRLPKEEALIREAKLKDLYGFKNLTNCIEGLETSSNKGSFNKGKSLSEEHKSRIGKANKGKTHTEETKKKWSLAQRGNRNKARKVRCIENNTVYNGSSEASRILKINQSNIIGVCRGIRTHCGGYTFEYVE